MEIAHQFPFSFTITFLLFMISFMFLLGRGWTLKKRNLNFASKSFQATSDWTPSPLRGRAPHQVLEKLSQKHGPIMYLKLVQVATAVVSSRELAKDLLRVHDVACSDRPETIVTKILWHDHTNIAFSPYNEYWRQMREITIVELLSAKNVRSFSSIRQDEASRLVKSLQASSGETINLTEIISTFSSSITCRAVFGSPMRNRETLIALLREAVLMTGSFELTDLFPPFKLLEAISKHKLLRMRRKLDSILDLMVDAHREKGATSKAGNGEFGGEGIIDVLLRTKHTGALDFTVTNNNIKGITIDLFAAGTETASTTVSWAMAELLRNPDVMAKAQVEIRQAFNGKRTIEEADLQALEYLKVSRQEIEVGGYAIPVKTKILINAWGLGRDPAYWDEPDSFKPERFQNSATDFLGSNFEYIPFGSGRRICPGMNFGLANFELPLAQLLYHFDWKLPEGKKISYIDMTEAVGGIAVAMKNDIFLIPKSYTATVDG